MYTMLMKPSRTEEAGPTSRRAGQGWAQGERVSDKLQLRWQGALGCCVLVGQGPPHNWRSWERVQSWPGVVGRWHWAGEIQELHVIRDFSPAFENLPLLKEWEYSGHLKWPGGKLTRREKENAIRRTWKKYMVEEVQFARKQLSVCTTYEQMGSKISTSYKTVIFIFKYWSSGVF